MKKKRLFLVIFLLLITALSVVFLFRDSSRGKSSGAVGMSVKEAKDIAKDNINFFEAWTNPVFQESYIFYNLDGVGSAYLFNVSDNYGKAGYVVIGSDGDVVEISKDTNTPVVQALLVVNELTQGTIYEQEDIKAQYLYIGDKKYYVKIEVREGEVTQTLYFLLSKEGSKEISLDKLSS
ncbi:MAG TPA: hypothetical protein ENK81_01815 [Euryarchaeota archaeon]|nr:hypothetical protein [Euryarchaeota archaeon]